MMCHGLRLEQKQGRGEGAMTPSGHFEIWGREYWNLGALQIRGNSSSWRKSQLPKSEAFGSTTEAEMCLPFCVAGLSAGLLISDSDQQHH